MPRPTIRYADPRDAVRAFVPVGAAETVLLAALAERIEAAILSGARVVQTYEVDTTGWPHRLPELSDGERAALAARLAADRRAHRREQFEAEWKERMRDEAAAAWDAMFVRSADAADEAAVDLGFRTREEITHVPAPKELLAALGDAGRAVAAAEAARLRAVVALVGPEPSPSSLVERQKVAEIAAAASMSHLQAESLIHRARMLAGPFACFGAALAAGEVSLQHCLALVAQTALVSDPEVLAGVAHAVLPHARRKVVAEFRRCVDAAVAALDPDVVARRERARAGRRVYTVRGTDGMSTLGLVHETAVVDAVYRQLIRDGRLLLDARLEQRAAADAAAEAGIAAVADAAGIALSDDPGSESRVWQYTETPADGDLSSGACRADALAARILGTTHEDGSVTWEPAASQVVTVEVVMDLDTLTGLRDHVALLDGEPVPAQTARDVATLATWFRRVVVDPVDGHLLDYGDRTYLPEPVRRFVFARDGGCVTPGCTKRAARFLQLDHTVEFPHGPSSSANGRARCTECHQRKTAGLTSHTDARADGSETMTTAWGQTVRIRPRRYLPETPYRWPPPGDGPPPF